MIKFIYYYLLALLSVTVPVHITGEAVEVEETQTKVLEQSKESDSVEVLEEYAEQYAENNDMAGYIYLPNGIEYPVMFTPYNQNYYADHDFSKEKSKEGVPFLNRYSLLGEQGISLMYGHHLKSGKGFTVLKHYLQDDGYFEANRSIRIDTLYSRQEYEVVAVALTSLHEPFEYYNYVGQVSEQEFEEWKNGFSDYCIKGDLSGLSYEDSIMELSTCYYHKEDGRLVIILKAV